MNTGDHSMWLAVISLIAAGQGVFLSAVLAGRKRNKLANHVLALAMFLFSFELATTFFHGSGLDERFPHLIGVTYGFPFLYSPVFLLYAQALTGTVRRITFKHLAHFVPFLAVTIYTIPFYALSGREKLQIVKDPTLSGWTSELFVIDHLIFVYSLIYLIGIVVVIARHRKRVRDRFSTLDKVNLDWLRFLAFGGLTTWTVSLVFYLFGLAEDGDTFDPIEGNSDFVSLALAAFVYGIGYMGLRQPEIFEPELAAEVEDARAASYARSGVDEATAADMERRLIHLMETKTPYRDPELTLSQLAEWLEVTPHNLSQVINSKRGVNFYDFVNGYRVEEVKRRITDDSASALTLLSIGLDAGFNSKSSFNAVFKKVAGCTPSEYRTSVRARSTSSN